MEQGQETPSVRNVEIATPTREEIVEHIRVAYNQRLAADIRTVMERFGTVQSFLDASHADLQKAHRLARPDNARDLGRRFFLAHAECVSFVNERRIEQRREIEREDRDFIANELRERRENPRFTLAQLQSIVSFMQLCSVSEIDLKGAVEYFRVMKVDIATATTETPSPPPSKPSSRGGVFVIRPAGGTSDIVRRKPKCQRKNICP